MQESILLSSEFWSQFALFFLVLSPIAFIVGLVMVAASKETRKLGVKIIIGSVIAFIIGFGTCFATLSIGAH